MSTIRYSNIFPKDILALTTDSSVDFAFQKSTPCLNKRQKQILRKETGLSIDNVFNVEQIHGKRVIKVNLASIPTSKISKADASMTNVRGVALSVRTADCLPIFIFDPIHQAISIVHAGWKSTKKRIVQNVLKTMKKKYKTRYKDLKVAFGPALHSCCFEVDKIFARSFSREVEERGGKIYFDMVKANKNQLCDFGVVSRNIKDCKLCTFCDKDLFSFRKKGLKAGRMLSVLMLKK